MEINLVYFDKWLLSVVTDHNDPDRLVSPQLEGDENAIAAFDLELALGLPAGFYGHVVNWDLTTNLDLEASIRQIVKRNPAFRVSAIVPEITPNPIPDGILT